MLFSGDGLCAEGVPSVRRWALPLPSSPAAPYLTQRSPDEGDRGAPVLMPFGDSARRNGCRRRGKEELAHHTQ